MKLKTEDVLLYGGLAFLAYKFLLPKQPQAGLTPAQLNQLQLNQAHSTLQPQQPNTASTIVSSLTALAPVLADLIKPKTPAINPIQSTSPVNVYEQYDTPTVPQDYSDIYNYQPTVNQDPSPLQSFFQNGDYKNYGGYLAGIGSVQDERAGNFGWY